MAGRNGEGRKQRTPEAMLPGFFVIIGRSRVGPAARRSGQDYSVSTTATMRSGSDSVICEPLAHHLQQCTLPPGVAPQ